MEKNITGKITQTHESDKFVSLSRGHFHTVAIKEDGSLWAWGYDIDRKLGLGSTTNKDTPTQVGVDTDWALVACGYEHTLAIKTDGTLWMWDWSSNGRPHTNRNKPTQVGNDKDWVMITCGYNHTVGLKQDGSLWSWGYNAQGQLGLGDSGSGTHRTTPTQVGSDKDWILITAGGYHTLGLKQDGSLWSWGDNYYSQLGLGDSGSGTHRTTPTQVGTDKDWVMITAGSLHTLGLKQDGSLWSWGNNMDGQLGLGDTTDRTTPTPVGSDKDWVIVNGSRGGDHTLVLKEDGSLWAWGWNTYGQLGLNDTTNRYTPTQVGSDKDWVMITGGAYHTLGIKQDGSLWSWGSNIEGQLGLGNSGSGTDRTTPTQVGITED